MAFSAAVRMHACNHEQVSCLCVIDVMLGKPYCHDCGPMDRHGTHDRKVRKHGLVYLIWMLVSMSAAGFVNVVKFVYYATHVAFSAAARTHACSHEQVSWRLFVRQPLGCPLRSRASY